MKDKLLQLLPYYRWHPEVALRYLSLVREINQLSPSSSVLEVGSGGLGVAPYLGRKITGLDLNFSPPRSPLVRRVKGSGDHLPFPDKSFSVVLCVDTLEHVPPQKRRQVIGEMLRVAQKKVLIAVPTSQASQLEDQKLGESYHQARHRDFPFLLEHQHNGLWEHGQMLSVVTTESRKYRGVIRTFGNENLSLRRFLMRGWISTNLLTNLVHRKVMLFFLPVLRFLDRPPYYRTIYIVDLP